MHRLRAFFETFAAAAVAAVFACFFGSAEPAECNLQMGLQRSPVVCSAKGVCRFQILLEGVDQWLELSLYHRPARSNAPTLIVFAGGPGESVLDRRDDWIRRLDLPAHFGLILMDPRGVAGNSLGSALQRLPEFQRETILRDNLKSKLLAEDLLHVLLNLRIERVIIYGVSYGTAPGLILAHQIEALQAAPNASTSPTRLTAIVLDSVLDRAEEGQQLGRRLAGSFNATLNRLTPIQRFRARIKLSELAKFYQSQGNGVSPLNLLLQGLTVRRSNDPSLIGLLRLAQSIGGQELDRLREYVESLAPLAPSMDQITFFHHVYCNDLTLDAAPGFPVVEWDQVSHRLKPSGTRSCDQPTTDLKFQSRNFKVRAPIVYLTGGEDAATPRSYALSHAATQSSSVSLIEIFRATWGHAVLTGLTAQCKLELWSVMAGDTSLNNSAFFSVQEKCK